MKVSKKVSGVEYAIRDIVSSAKDLEKQGKIIDYLNIGDPALYGFHPPENVKQAYIDAIKKDQNYYSASEGIQELRSAIAEKENSKGLSIGADDVLITNGVSEGLDMVMSSIVEEGDEVLLPGPYYPPYASYIRLRGGIPIEFSVDLENSTPDITDIKSKITPKTVAICLISPNNPTGAVFDESSLKQLIDVANENNLYIICDEIYDQIVFDKKFVGIGKVAAFYINQIEVAKNIVKSLPIEYRLLVKEHPASGLRSWRKIDVYKELISTPNIVPIHHSANTEELIKKSSLVISLSGSTSLDAVFFEKPSIVFADTDYSMIPEVRKIDKIENLSNTIHDALKTKVDQKNIEKYVQFIEKNSFDYNFILHVIEMQKYVFHGSLLVDVEFSEEEINEFFDKTKSRFQQLKNAYLEYIQKDF